MKWLFVFSLFPFWAAAQSKIDSLNDLGFTLYERQQYDSALIVFGEELKLTKGNNPYGEARTLVNMGIVYLDKNDLDKAMEFFENSTVTAEKINDSVIMASCYLSSGMVHERKASYLLAKQLYLKAARIFSDLGDRDGLSSSYNSVGNIQNKLGEFNSALFYYQKSLHLWTELKDSLNHKADIAASLNNIGDLYKENKQYDKALSYLSSALFYKREIGNDQSTAHTLSALGEVYELKGKLSLALRYYQEAYKIRENVGDRIGIANSANLLASIYLTSKKYTDAEKYLLESRKIAGEDSLRGELLKNYDLSRKLYRNTNQFQLALQYDELYIKLDHLLLDEAAIRALKEMEVKYEAAENLEKNKRLVEELKQEEALSYFKTGGIVSLLMIIALILLAYFQKIKGKRKTEALMRELNHRVKNNMQVLSSLLSLQYDQLEDKSARAAIQETRNRVKAMGVVHRKLYLGKELSLVSIHDFIMELTAELRMSYGFEEAEKVAIHFDLDNLEILADKAIPLGLIMNEILSNAFKYAFTDKYPRLDISLKKVNKGVTIIVKDNGNGIHIDNQHKDSFGFKLIKMLCKQLHAKLEIKNEHGACIIVSIDNC